MCLRLRTPEDHSGYDANERGVPGRLNPSSSGAPGGANAYRRQIRETRGAAYFSIFPRTVHKLRLPAGAWSSQRHWHSAKDEFVYVLEAGRARYRLW